jgi:tetratricopeptide (TPR) repeat protein
VNFNPQMVARKKTNNEAARSIGRVAGVAGLVVIFLVLTWNAGREGFSSLLSAYAAGTYEIDAANAAVGLSSSSPDAHFVRGTILEARNDPVGAAAEYNAAALARPDACILWLSLARARELSGDTEGALAAARQAVPLAPYYAQPHWQLGNILLRAGLTDEGFKELRLAGISNPTLMPSVIDLAWRLSDGDPRFVERAVQPKTTEAYQALGQYLRHLGDLQAALYIYESSNGRAPESERRANIAALIGAKRFGEAYALWARQRQGTSPGVINDSGFEEEEDLQEPGFRWRTVDKAQGFNLSLDASDAKQGRSSLRIDFDGDSDPAAAVVSQLVMVEARTHYQLGFAARTEDIVSGGLPHVVVSDANSNNVLGQSAELPQATNGWRNYVFDFDTGESSTAIQISLQRLSCTSAQCPIFGSLWLDDVWLQKL